MVFSKNVDGFNGVEIQGLQRAFKGLSKASKGLSRLRGL